MKARTDHAVVRRDKIQPAAIAGACIGLALILAGVAGGAQLSFEDWGLVVVGNAVLLLFLLGVAVLCCAVIAWTEEPFDAEALGSVRGRPRHGPPRDYEG